MTLARVQNNGLKAENGETPLTVAEILRSLTESIWADLPNGKSEKIVDHPPQFAASISQGSQPNRVAGQRAADGASLARMHLRDTGRRIDMALADKKISGDDTVRADLEESKEQIGKTLGVLFQSVNP